MTKATKTKLEKIAIRICDQHLGSIPRGKTIDALDAKAGLLGTNKRREVMYDQLREEFAQWVEEHIPRVLLPPQIKPDGTLDNERVDMDADERDTIEAWDKVEPMFQIAWREVARRIDYGQTVEKKLEALGIDLAWKLSVYGA